MVPIFANQAADAATEHCGPISPTPALVSADDGDVFAQFGEPGDFTNPAQVGLAFWLGLLADLELARTHTYAPDAWGDYRWAIDLLADKSLASKVIDAVDAPGVMAFMRFVPEVAGTSQVFAPFATSAVILTLVRLDDGTWRAWGLGPGIRSARAVLGEDRASAAQFQIGGGTALVFTWLTELVVDEPAVELIWGCLMARCAWPWRRAGCWDRATRTSTTPAATRSPRLCLRLTVCTRCSHPCTRGCWDTSATYTATSTASRVSAP